MDLGCARLRRADGVLRGSVRGADWAAVRQILGGVVRRPSNADSWGERETRRRVVCIAGAIGELQDIVWQNIQEWKEKTVKERGEYIKQEERLRTLQEAERGWRVQRKRGRRQRVQVERQVANWEEVASVNHAR